MNPSSVIPFERLVADYQNTAAHNDASLLELLAPEDGVSAGQACVFYAPEGSRILGGGWIWKG